MRATPGNDVPPKVAANPPAVERVCAKARSPSLLQWTSEHRYLANVVLWLTLLGAAVAVKYFVVDRIVSDLRNATSSNFTDAAIQMQWLLSASAVLGILFAFCAVRYGWRIFRGQQVPEPQLFSTRGTLSAPRTALQGILYMVVGIFLLAISSIGVWGIWLLESLKNGHP